MQQNGLEELAAQERRAYFKEWRKKNTDKIKKHNDTYWKKRAERKAQELQSEREAQP